MFLKKWLKRRLKGALLLFLPVALLASLTDAAMLWGVRSFMDIVGGEGPLPVWGWVVAMLVAVSLRLFFLYHKNRIVENFTSRISARVMAWFLLRLRKLSPREFHLPRGNQQVESAYEATRVLQSDGSVFFQAIQAALQLMVFLPVLLYISWMLTLFLFVVVVPFVALLQRKLHRLGPAEESLLRSRSGFRGELTLARELLRKWSSATERRLVLRGLLQSVRKIRDATFSAGIQKMGISLLTEAVSVLAMVVVLAFCALLMARGYMDASGLVLFSSAVLLCYKPVKECARVMPQFRAAASALDVLESFERLETVKPAVAGGGALACGGDFHYEGSAEPVFSSFTLCLNRSKPVLIRGKNGAGKSTLLRLWAGLEFWDGCGNRPHPVAADVFFVAQDLELPPRWMLERSLEGIRRTPRAEPVETFAKEAGALPLLSKTGLSGGERARVALLWALASNAQTVLLDEPFASVALADREPLLKSFLLAASRLDKWTIIVSHDVLSPEIEVKFRVVHL